MNTQKIPSLDWCREHHIALIERIITREDPTGLCKIAVLDDSDELLLEKLKLEFNSPIELVVKSEKEIRSLQKKNQLNLYENRENDNSDLEALRNLRGNTSNSWETEPIINLVDSLIEVALSKGATDIHIEPSDKNLRIRFRQDGMLCEYRNLPLWLCDPVLIRLKILAEVDITDKRIPHDGSFTYNGFKASANIRLSTIPVQSETAATEKCVLRLLPLSNEQAQDESQGLSRLQISSAELTFLRKVFQSPQGLFLVTGPTGSGKTTTLHAGLQEIVHRQINITTIEDPVEYILPKVNQVQVNEKYGFTFASALRSILRQDPDVILVGEIRDAETAKIALRAAQTGHLVLSTLHTNSAKAAYTRLQDLGINANALQESLLGIMAQRLVRIRQQNCKLQEEQHSSTGDMTYCGRRVITEILRPDGTYVNGTLRDCAQSLLNKGITDSQELYRVLGLLY